MPLPTGTIAALLRVETYRDHNSSYFLSVFFCSRAQLSPVTSLLTSRNYVGIKRQRKNNNRPVDPHFTNLGGMGEIHLHPWYRPADWAWIGFLLGSWLLPFLSEDATPTDLHPTYCAAWVRCQRWAVPETRETTVVIELHLNAASRNISDLDHFPPAASVKKTKREQCTASYQSKMISAWTPVSKISHWFNAIKALWAHNDNKSIHEETAVAHFSRTV